MRSKADRMLIDARLRNMLRKAPPGAVYTHEQIADAAGITRQAVQQTEARALRKLARQTGRVGSVLSEILAARSR